MQLRAWQLQLAEHCRNTTMKLGLMAKKKGKAKKKKPQRSKYKDEITDFLFAEGLEMRRKSKEKKPKRNRYSPKDEIPDFLFRTCMSRVRNTAIFYILLNWYIMRNTNIKKRTQLQSIDMFTSYGHIKKPNKNT